MLFFTLRRANQLTMPKKLRAEKLLKIRDEEQLRTPKTSQDHNQKKHLPRRRGDAEKTKTNKSVKTSTQRTQKSFRGRGELKNKNKVLPAPWRPAFSMKMF